MALPAISWLLLSLLVMLIPVPGICQKIVRTGNDSFLIQCYDPAPAPAPAPAHTDATNGTAFRAILIRLLGELPLAAAPTGFASLNSTVRDSAYVRGLCFDDDAAPVPSECLGCLTVAARNLTYGCGTPTRRAGIWTDGCFVAYADTEASSPSEDAFRARVLLGGHVAVPFPDAGAMYYSHYVHNVHATVVAAAQFVAEDVALDISGPRMVATANETSDDGWPVRTTVHVLAQCARDLTEDECGRCLAHSVQTLDWDLDGARSDGGVAAAVVGFNCYLRFEVSCSLLPPELNSAIVGVSAGALALLVLFSIILWNLE